jgi:hypothetical protein
MCHDDQSSLAAEEVDEELEKCVDREGLKSRRQHQAQIE